MEDRLNKAMNVTAEKMSIQSCVMCALCICFILGFTCCHRENHRISDKVQHCMERSISGLSINNNDGLVLSWRIDSPEKTLVRIDYEIINRSSVTIHVLDILLRRHPDDSFSIIKDRMIADIYDSTQPELIELILGHADPVSHSQHHWGPGSRKLMPGSVIGGHVDLAYPFEIWHYNRHDHNKITFEPSAVILRFGYLIDKGIPWITQKLSNGENITLPAPGYTALNQRIVSSSIIRWSPCR